VASAWDWSDAWLLMAIALYEDEGCDLVGLIAAADACNHAIPTRDEIAQGIGRLEASSLVRAAAGQFTLTTRGRDLAARRSGGYFEQSGSLHAILLEEQPLVEGEWPVSSAACHAAYERYHATGIPARFRGS
jgi:hypothetical protein